MDEGKECDFKTSSIVMVSSNEQMKDKKFHWTLWYITKYLSWNGEKPVLLGIWKLNDNYGGNIWWESGDTDCLPFKET